MGNKSPSISSPVIFTVVALIDLVATFISVATKPHPSTLYIFPIIEVMLIAIAIYSWVGYFRAYVQFEIANKIQNIEINHNQKNFADCQEGNGKF